MATQQELAQWLQEGIQAAKIGRLEQARFRLLDVVEQDQTNEAAWYWLYQVFDRHSDKRVCLENLLTINPHNQWAKNELRRTYPPSVSPSRPKSRQPAPKPVASKTVQPVRAKPARPVTLKLVTAFWFGLSVMLLGGGVVAVGQWLAAAARTRSFPYYLTGQQVIELLAATGFIIAGLLGLVAASLLLARSMAGFYSSIVLALALLLVGPIVSLIVDPPSYITMVCTGGISGMIVLLTLASQAGFNHTSPGKG